MLSRVLTIFYILSSFLIFGQETKYRVSNISTNSSLADLIPKYLDANTIVYASSKRTEDEKIYNKSRRKRQKQNFLALYKAAITENGDLVDQGRFLDQSQQIVYLADFAIAPNGKTIYFIWNNYQPFMINDTVPTYWRNLRIMKGTLNAQSEIDIPNAKPLPFVNLKNNYNHISLSPDGKTLYFSADLPKGAGGMDLYKVNILGNDSYSEPENLGNAINSSQDELFPFVDATNTLYFSSYGHRGRGGLDIFKSKFENGSYKTIEQLGDPVNSKADDFAFIIDPSTNTGYFTSDRDEGKGDVDIYNFEPDIPECTQTIVATFVNSETKEPLKNLEISHLDENGEVLNSIFVVEISPASLQIKCETKGSIRIEKEGFEPFEAAFESGDVYNEQIIQQFDLIETPCMQIITGDILNKLELNPVTEATVSIYDNDTLVKEQILTGTETFNIEVPCNTEYNLVVKKDGFESYSTITRTGNKIGDSIAKNILLTPRVCSQSIQLFAYDVESTNPISKFKTRLLSNGILIDEKNIVNGNEFTFDLNCESNYTIEIEKVGYELKSVAISTDEEYSTTHTKELELKPIPCKQYVVLQGATQNDLNALANANIKILRDGQEINSTSGINEIQIPCNSNITLQIDSPGFDTKNVQIRTTNEFERKHEMRVSMLKTICEQEFVLSVADSNSKAGLTSFNLEIHDGTSAESKYIRNGSTAIITLKCDTNYRIKIEQDGYETFEFPVNTSNTNGESLNETAFLIPLVCEQIIAGEIIDKETSEPLANALVTISSGNSFSKNLLLDAQGRFTFKAECATTYSIKASLMNYGNTQIMITTSTVRNETHDKTIAMEKDLEFTTIAGQRMINTNNIIFELNRIDINLETAIELNKVVALLNKYPDLKLLVKSHTDSRAPDHLNLNLTEGRARAIKNYLISKGIDISRITAKGLGETELLNKCANGVKCSDEEHRKNRRTEFIVTN